eukprot:2631982-Alexandrium_andersonii.AAC.1
MGLLQLWQQELAILVEQLPEVPRRLDRQFGLDRRLDRLELREAVLVLSKEAAGSSRADHRERAKE